MASPVGLTPSGLAPLGMATEQDILDRASTENFKVASCLLPKATRQHLLAFYGFARLVDYLGDDYPGDRLAALDWLQAQTGAALSDPAGPERPPARRWSRGRSAGGRRRPECVDGLTRPTGRIRSSPATTPSTTVGYCRLSANPVGRLVLAAFGATTPERVAWSDAICTGLQLADIGRRARGRLRRPGVPAGRGPRTLRCRRWPAVGAAAGTAGLAR